MSPAPNDVYRLACLELRGGNRAAVYSADLPGLSAWISCRPLHPATQGGDLYYLSVCSNGAISRVTLADVSGHGESASTLAERLREALREHVDHWDQSALIRQLNDSFLSVTKGSRFASAILLSQYAGTGQMLFTNAGHPPPLWYRAEFGEWVYLNDQTPFSKAIADLPLGMIPGTSYTQTAVQLDPEDLLLLYTDAINESADQSGEQLGLDGLMQIACGLPVRSAAEAGEALLAAVAQFRGSFSPADDETVVALRREPRLGAL